jgi:hypothetical protein
MKTTFSVFASILLAASGGYCQTIDLVSLGSDTFTIEAGATTAAHSQTASGIVFNGSYALGNTLGGTFVTQDWSSASFTEFGLVMTLTGANPNLPFAVDFYDASFDIINTYEGFTLGVGSSPTYVPLTLILPGTGILSAVSGIQFTWNGDGAIDTTVQSVAAVPEPSTYVLLALAGVGLGGYVFRRRLRA